MDWLGYPNLLLYSFNTLAKTILFYLYFMSILMLSHLFYTILFPQTCILLLFYLIGKGKPLF